MTERVYVNGRFVTPSRASVSVFDRGLSYGDGLFETMKARQGRVIFFKEHIGRLRTGARELGIPTGLLKEKDIHGVIKKLLRTNGLLHKDAYIRITLTRGVDRDGHSPKRGIKPTIIIAAKGIDNRKISSYKIRGVRAVLLDKDAPSHPGGVPSIPGIKSLNYLPSVLGKGEAQRRGAFEGIFTGPGSRLKEGTSTNLFLVINGTVRTPPLDEGLLAGITRKKVLEIAENNGLRTIERPLYAKDLRRCEEAFLTNSIIEVAPLVEVEDFKIGSGRPGEVTRKLQELLTAESGRDI